MRADPRQPEWSPSGAQAPDSATYRDEACGQREIVVQRAVNVPGESEPVIVSMSIAVPHLPYVNMLDPRGNVCPVVVSNNRVAMQPSISYRTALLAHWRRKGWVRWDYLPAGSYELEPAQFNMTAEQWALRREEIRKERLTRASVESEAYQVKGADKDLAEAIKGNTEALARILDRVLAGQASSPLAAEPPPPGKPGRGRGADAGTG